MSSDHQTSPESPRRIPRTTEEIQAMGRSERRTTPPSSTTGEKPVSQTRLKSVLGFFGEMLLHLLAIAGHGAYVDPKYKKLRK